MRARTGVRVPIAVCLGILGCGTAEPGSPSGGGLAILDGAPPPAVATEPYGYALTARNAGPALRWSLPERDPELDWLSVDSGSGLLRGTPPTVVLQPAAFRVRATEGASTAEHLFSLTVTCREGAHLACTLPSGDRCHAGIAICAGGRLDRCTDSGAPSSDRARCGQGCTQACDDLLTNRCEGACVCGGTGGACGAGTQCCGDAPAGTCVDTQTSTLHCGTCRTDCTALTGARQNVTPGCERGACVYSCLAPFGDCDGNVANGCETDTGRSLAHCGGCGRACGSGPGQIGVSPSCTAGECVHPCTGTWRNCSPGAASPLFGEDADGCETRLGTVSSCLGCGDACPVPPLHGIPVCTPAGCGVLCDSGFDACGSECVDLSADRFHCGSCTTVCSLGRLCFDGLCCPPGGC